MNLVRAISSDGDWTFGSGKSCYLTNNAMIAQNVQTRLREEIGDCFFNLGAGIDPLLYGQKSILALDLAIRGIILGTSGVVGIASLTSKLSVNRVASFTYKIVTSYGTITDAYTYTIQQGA